MTTWFTSDTHFGHERMLDFRPFNTIDEMDSCLIYEWNHRVADSDTVYVVGDFSFYNIERTRQLLRKLSGQKFLIQGNHDSKSHAKLFAGSWQLRMVKITLPVAIGESERRQKIFCAHYPMRVWDQRHYGVWHLHGHSHGNLPELDNELSIDVGVDAQFKRNETFAPVRDLYVEHLMMKKDSWPRSVSLDHH